MSVDTTTLVTNPPSDSSSSEPATTVSSEASSVAAADNVTATEQATTANISDTTQAQTEEASTTQPALNTTTEAAAHSNQNGTKTETTTTFSLLVSDSAPPTEVAANATNALNDTHNSGDLIDNDKSDNIDLNSAHDNVDTLDLTTQPNDEEEASTVIIMVDGNQTEIVMDTIEDSQEILEELAKNITEFEEMETNNYEERHELARSRSLKLEEVEMMV